MREKNYIFHINNNTYCHTRTSRRPIKNYHLIGKKNRYLASCSFKRKCFVKGVAT